MLPASYSCRSTANGISTTFLLSEFLQQHVLPHLTPQSLAALRSTCRSYRQLIDNAPASCMAPVVADMLPAGLLQHAERSCDVQHLFRQQPTWLAHMRSGRPYRTQSVPTNGHHAIASWFPEPAEPQLIVMSVPKPAADVPSQKLTSQHLEWDSSNQPNSGAAATALMKPSWALPRLQVVLPDGKAVDIKAAVDIRRVTLYPSPQALPRPFLPADREEFWQPHWCSTGFHLAVHRWDGHGMALAICDLSLLDDQPDPAVSCLPHFRNPEIGAAFSPTKDAALVCLQHSPQHLTALHLPTLSPRYSISVGPLHATLHPRWAAYAPDGRYFAVARAQAHEVAKHLAVVQLLSIHTSRDGARQAQLDIQHVLPGMRTRLAPRPHCMPFAWSQTSSCLSVSCEYSPQLNSPDAGAHAIMHLNGSLNILPQLPTPKCRGPHDSCHASWCWSHCGLFFSYCCNLSTIGTHDRCRCVVPPPDANVGCIWGVKSQQQLFSWRESYLHGKVVWAPSYPICYVYSLHAVVVMPPEPGLAVLQIRVEGPELWPATGIDESWGFSPCSQVLVASWPASQLPLGSGNPATRMLQHWHGWLNLEEPCYLSAEVNQPQPVRQYGRTSLSSIPDRVARLPWAQEANGESREREMGKLLLSREGRRHEVLQAHNPARCMGTRVWFSEDADLAWNERASTLTPSALMLSSSFALTQQDEQLPDQSSSYVNLAVLRRPRTLQLLKLHRPCSFEPGCQCKQQVVKGFRYSNSHNPFSLLQGSCQEPSGDSLMLHVNLDTPCGILQGLSV